MTFKKLFAASVCMALVAGMASQAFAQDRTMKGQELDPNFKGTVNVDVIDNNNQTFFDRIQSELVEKPAPQVGQTRAAIEALYGPSQVSLAPNKNFEIYTNEFDMTDGKLFRRNITDGALRIYEVSYNTGSAKSANDKAVDVKLRVIPRHGDHKNLVTKLMGQPANKIGEQNGQRMIFGIPKQRYVFYNDVIPSPHHAVSMYFNAEGNLVGQEFIPGPQPGQYSLTTAGRYIEFENKAQPDRKIGW